MVVIYIDDDKLLGEYLSKSISEMKFGDHNFLVKGFGDFESSTDR